MSTQRPYDDYVRASDLLHASVTIGGNWNPGTLSYLDFPQDDFAIALQSHNVFLNTIDLSDWSSIWGGEIRANVGAITDFAHVADVADAFAQAAGEIGYRTANQSANSLLQIPDDITPAEQAQYTRAARKVNFRGGQNTITDTIENAPGNIHAGVQQTIKDIGDALPDLSFGSGYGPLLVIGGVAAVVLFLSGRE